MRHEGRDTDRGAADQRNEKATVGVLPETVAF